MRKNWQSARKRAALLHMHTRPFTFFSPTLPGCRRSGSRTRVSSSSSIGLRWRSKRTFSSTNNGFSNLRRAFESSRFFLSTTQKRLGTCFFFGLKSNIIWQQQQQQQQLIFQLLLFVSAAFFQRSFWILFYFFFRLLTCKGIYGRIACRKKKVGQ